jgi:hypothetical protein
MTDSTNEIEKPQCVRVPIKDILFPFDGARVVTDCYWVVEAGHVLYYRGFAPQCNAIKEIAIRLAGKLYPDCEIRHLPVAYVKDEYP